MAEQEQAPQGGSLAPAEVYAAPQRKRGSKLPTMVWLLLVLAAAIGGAFVGSTLLAKEDPINFGTLGGRTAISEDQLDDAVATYVFGGEVYQVTAREALAQQGSLDSVKNSDGSYAMPSAESVLSAARTAVLMRDVEAHEISVTDDEVLAYAQKTFGTDDLASLAAAYTMDTETLKDRLRESAAIAKLRIEIAGEPTEPLALPAAPEEGKEEEPTADYAAYVISLAGDEWDAEKGAWASEDGTFATALKDYDVRSDAATYAAAQTAYNVAYQLYSSSMTAAGTHWTEYVNDQLCQASVAISSLVS